MTNNNTPVILHYALPDVQPTSELGTLLTAIKNDVDAYNHFYLKNDVSIAKAQEFKRSIAELKNSRARNDVTIQQLKWDYYRYKQLKNEIQWREAQADSLASEGIVDQLAAKALPEYQRKVKRLMEEYQFGAHYMKHSSNALYELCTVALPALKHNVELAIKKSKKESLKKPLRALLTDVNDQYSRIASTMMIRLEASFNSPEASQDDPLAYTYNRLIEWRAADNKNPKKPRQTLNSTMPNYFYQFIQVYGRRETKLKLTTLIRNHEYLPIVFSSQAHQAEGESETIRDRREAPFKTSTRLIGEIPFQVPTNLEEHIPKTKPAFGRGALFRYEFFRKYQHIILGIKRAYYPSRIYTNTIALNEVLVSHGTLQLILEHKAQLENERIALKGKSFLGDSRKFIQQWEDELNKIVEFQIEKSKHYLQKSILQLNKMENCHEKDIKRKIIAKEIGNALVFCSQFKLDNPPAHEELDDMRDAIWKDIRQSTQKIDDLLENAESSIVESQQAVQRAQNKMKETVYYVAPHEAKEVINENIIRRSQLAIQQCQTFIESLSKKSVSEQQEISTQRRVTFSHQ